VLEALGRPISAGVSAARRAARKAARNKPSTTGNGSTGIPAGTHTPSAHTIAASVEADPALAAQAAASAIVAETTLVLYRAPVTPGSANDAQAPRASPAPIGPTVGLGSSPGSHTASQEIECLREENRAAIERIALLEEQVRQLSGAQDVSDGAQERFRVGLEDVEGRLDFGQMVVEHMLQGMGGWNAMRNLSTSLQETSNRLCTLEQYVVRRAAEDYQIRQHMEERISKLQHESR
jgi:hypothetical protein